MFTQPHEYFLTQDVASVGIRVDVALKSGGRAVGLLTHNDLEKCVGDAIAAFALEILKPGIVPAGVYFPEEVPSISFRNNILNYVSKDAIAYNILSYK